MTTFSGIWTHKTVAILAISAGLSFPALAVESPRIQSVLPTSAITSPGTKVKVFGTGFAPDAVVYFDGLQSRETNFISSTELEAETPYLRSGTHLLQISSGGVSARSDVKFSALPSEADAQIDRAIEIARQGKTDEAISALEQIGQTNSDYQVRAAAFYEVSQIYFNLGDFFDWRVASALIYLDAAKSGMAVQTSWRYGLAFAQSQYLLNEQSNARADLRLADIVIDFDVTQDPEPRFYRAVLNARSGNLAKAQVDSVFVSKAWPNRPSAAALAAYIAALGGDAIPLRSMTSGPIPTDATASALLGEGLLATGDAANAKRFWAAAVDANPTAITMPCLAAKKHLNSGQKPTAKILLSECTAMAPDSKEGQAARETLSDLEKQ
jgi:tetratricopeptide (TPR) repeat protein